MEYRYTHHDDTHTIRLDAQPDGSYTATIGPKTYRVTLQRQGDDQLSLLVDGQPLRAYFAAERATGQHPARYHVALDGSRTYVLARAEQTAGRRSTQVAGSGALTAQMPGQVMQVLVAAGDAVEAGQKLLVMEAMKMEIVLTAPQDGVVSKLSVAEGQTVDRGQLLAVIE